MQTVVKTTLTTVYDEIWRIVKTNGQEFHRGRRENEEFQIRIELNPYSSTTDLIEILYVSKFLD